MTPPPIEQKPYPIKDPLLRELASKHLIYLHQRKRFLGPFTKEQLPFGAYSNAVFVKMKDITRQKILFLINYSAPYGNSINSAIPKMFTTLVYPTFAFYIAIASSVGPSGWISVADLKNAYYNVFMMRKYSKILAIFWQGLYLLPLFMPFGIATGCRTLQLILDVIQEALRDIFPEIFLANGKPLSNHYLDDECALHKTWSGAWLQAILWIIIVTLIGLPFSPTKIQLPRKIAQLLGFEINLLTQSYSLIKSKAKKYLKFVLYLIKNRHNATIKRIEKIVGRLRYAGQAIQGGNAFVRALEEQMNSLKSSGYGIHKHFSLNNTGFHELLFWAEALKAFNGVKFSYLLKFNAKITVTLFTDASANPELGCGGWDTLGNWFAIPWSNTLLLDAVKKKNIFINELEFITFAIAILALIDTYKNQVVCIRCDNMAAVIWFIRKAPSFKNKFHKIISFLLRKIMIKCLKNNIFIWIDYISTDLNKIADALSRKDYKAFTYYQKDFDPKVPRFRINPIKKFNKLTKTFKNLF